MIYIITTTADWAIATQQGYFETSSLKDEGFIHACTQEQTDIIIQKFYAYKKGLLKLHINESKVVANIKYELSPSLNEYFPHIYGVINMDAVEEVSVIAS